jgi:ABC-type arginine/histidine transport system permease subunit
MHISDTSILEIIITLPSISKQKKKINAKIEISLIYEHYSLVGIIYLFIFQ